MFSVGDVVRTTQELRGLHDQPTLPAGSEGVVTRLRAGNALVEVDFDGVASTGAVIVHEQHLELVAKPPDLCVDWDRIAAELRESLRTHLAPPQPDHSWRERPPRNRRSQNGRRPEERESNHQDAE